MFMPGCSLFKSKQSVHSLEYYHFMVLLDISFVVKIQLTLQHNLPARIDRKLVFDTYLESLFFPTNTQKAPEELWPPGAASPVTPGVLRSRFRRGGCTVQYLAGLQIWQVLHPQMRWTGRCLGQLAVACW